MFAESLSSEKHLNKIVGETYNSLKNIRVAFAYLDEDMIRIIFATLIGIGMGIRSGCVVTMVNEGFRKK